MSTQIHSLLFHRELGLASHQQVKRSYEEQVANNIANDRLQVNVIELSTNYDKLRKKDLLIATDKKCVSLWDICIGKKIWEISIETRTNLSPANYPNFLMDNDGTVAKIYWIEDRVPRRERAPLLVDIYFEGKKTGYFEFPKNKMCGRFTLESGYIFAIGEDTNSLKITHIIDDKDWCLYQWNRAGVLVNKISLLPEHFKHSTLQTITNEKYFILVTSNENQESRIFILDYHSGILDTYKLDFYIESFVTFLFGDNLFITSANLISIFSLSNRKIEKKFTVESFDEGGNFIANDIKAFFLHGRSIGRKESLYSLDLHTGIQNKIFYFDIPNNAVLSLSENLLTVCYRTDGYSSFCRVVFDIISNKIIYKVEYQKVEFPEISFDSGILLDASDPRKLYIENFTGYSHEESKQNSIEYQKHRKLNL